MDNEKKNLAILDDLPNYRDTFTVPLMEFGVKGIEDLRLVLGDEERTISMISAVKGLGPKIVQIWKKSLNEDEKVEEADIEIPDAEPSPEETRKEGTEPSPSEQPSVTIETPQEKEPEEPTEPVDVPVFRPKAERSLFCTMVELKDIQRTTTDLLRMNGSKKKGLAASVDYLCNSLTDTGMHVVVDRESEHPTIVASKGEGGLILWGHLDTERMRGMKKKEQGEVRGEMIRGRGAAEMKGAIAVMMCAANRLSSWQVPFSIVLTTDGLGEQQGAETLANSPVVVNSKGILIMAPTGMRPIIGQSGYAAVKVRTEGDQAVMRMAAFLKQLTGQIEESSGRLSVNTGLIRGGKKKRPFEPTQSCEVVMELETLDPTSSAITMLDEISAGDAEIEILCQSEMVEFDRNSELAKTIGELTKKEPAIELSHSEAAKLVPANKKIVVCGPGSVADSLTNQDYIALSELERTYEAVLALLDIMEPMTE
jgi:hypothetical protein